MKKGLHLPCISLALTLFLVSLSACFKQKQDPPPDNRGVDPDLTITHSIRYLRSLPVYQPIMEDIVVSGIVVMNDQRGNYFRKIVLQDSSGGMELLIAVNNLHYDYPVGRKLFLKCKGLYPGSYAANPQLGYEPDRITGFVTGIPALLVGSHIVKGSFPHQVIPDTFTLTQLNDLDGHDDRLNTLVVIKDVEFDTLDLDQTYAAPAVDASTTTLKVLDCVGKWVLLQTSGYAQFRSVLLPAGNGSITALYTRNYNQAQLYIRDTADVHLYGSRCNQKVRQLLYQNFSFGTHGTDVRLEGWSNFSVLGDRKYKKQLEGKEHFARITAFGGGNATEGVQTWLITPQLDLRGKLRVYLTFKNRDGYDNGAKLKVLVSEDYQGVGTPLSASWTTLPVDISSGTTTGYATEWTNVYAILPYSSPIHIAFLYEGGVGKTTTFDITNVGVFSD